jgi:hypothetical protein
MHQLRRPPISPSRYDQVAKSRRVPLALLRGNNNQLGDGDGCWIVAINQFELAQRGLERRTHYRSFGFENSDRHDQCLNLHPAGPGIARSLKAVGQRPDSWRPIIATARGVPSTSHTVRVHCIENNHSLPSHWQGAFEIIPEFCSRSCPRFATRAHTRNR